MILEPQFDALSIDGPEDRLVHELICAIRGRPLPTSEWEAKSWQLPIGPRGKVPGRESTNPSVNHWAVAAAVAARKREPRAAELTRLYVRDPHDLHMCECCVALPVYAAMNLLAFTDLRDTLRRLGGAADVVAALTAELRQMHALMIALSTEADNLPRSWALMAGPRGGSVVAPKPGKEVRGMREYMVLRSAVWSEGEIRARVQHGPQIVQQVSGDDPARAGTMIGTLTGLLSASLAEDAAPAWQAFRSGGYAELAARCIVGGRGTRYPLRWRRTEDGVVAILQAHGNPHKGPRVVEVWRRGEPYPTRWPYDAPKTGGLTECASDIDLEAGRVIASCEGMGSWSTRLPAGRVLYDVTSDRTGVRSLVSTAPPTPPPEPPVEPPAPPTQPPPGEPRQRDRDRSRTVLICIAGAALVALLAHLGGCS